MPRPDQSYDVPEEAPEEETGDFVRKLVKAGVSGVPIVGGPVAEFMDLIQPSIERRKWEWVEDIANELNRVRKRVKDQEGRDIFADEGFVTAVVKASRLAASTHQQEKREALRNAVLNAALRNEPDEDLQAIFMELVERYTPWHLRILKLFDEPDAWVRRAGIDSSQWLMGGPSQVLEAVFPEMKGQREFYDQLVIDLNGAGLMGIGTLHTTMTRDGMLARRTSKTGHRFLQFISAPDEPAAGQGA